MEVKRLTIKERKGIAAIIKGKKDINGEEASELLDREHVRKAFSEKMEEAGLSEEYLLGVMKEILGRKAVKMKNKEGRVVNTNIGSIDGNKNTTLTMAWKLKGKFKEKGEEAGELEKIGDKALTSFIKRGIKELSGEKKVSESDRGAVKEAEGERDKVL